MRTVFYACLFALTMVFGLSPGISAQTDCFAAGDVNGDGLSLSVADMVYLARFLGGEPLDSFVAYQADLNGDCVIDDLDLDLYNCYFELGLSCLPPDYPRQTCCEPSVAFGSCCFPPDSCKLLSEENCAAAGGNYWGDPECDMDFCCCDLPGDVNNDGSVNILDIVYFINYVYGGGPPPPCPAEAILIGNPLPSILDITFLIGSLYGNGPDPTCGGR